jgi:hypothetical protein
MPDKYLAQDNENQFDSLFFRGGKYQREAIVIPSIIGVSEIEDHETQKGYIFRIRVQYLEKIMFYYSKLNEAQQDRNDLLFQIERFWKDQKGGI